MKVYVLQGKHDAGKSLTLATLFTKYAANMKIISSYESDDVTAIKKQIADKYQAIRNGAECVSPYVLSVVEYNGIRIGLHTSGDDKKTAETSIKLFNGEISGNIPCDIGFCAARTKGITVKIFVKQPVALQGGDFETSNTEQAEYLLTLLNDFLGIK